MTARCHQVLNGSTKFKHALERGKSIPDIMTRNGIFVFGEMMTALEKFEEIIKDGVAPFVGREGHWVDPLSQLSSLQFTPDALDAGLSDVVIENLADESKSDSADTEGTAGTAFSASRFYTSN